MNNVSLIGRLTKDVEERRTQNGTPVASFTLAVNRRRKTVQTSFLVLRGIKQPRQSQNMFIKATCLE